MRRHSDMGARGSRTSIAAVTVAAALLLGACGEAGPPDRAAPAVPTSTPSSVEDLPEGPPAAYPWLAEGILHVGDVSIATDADRLVHRGGTTMVGRADDRRSRWWLFAGGRLEPLLDDMTPYLEPVLSADGGTAAWRVDVRSTRVDDMTHHYLWDVVVFDVPTRTVLGVTRLEGEVTCCDQGGMLMVTGVTNDGRVSLSGGPAGNLAIWRAGDRLLPVRVAATADTGADPWPLGVSYLLESDPAGKVRFGRVDASGAVTELGRASATGLWSADGLRVVDRVHSPSVQTTRIEVTVAVTGESVALALPPAPDWEVLAWEDERHVIAARVQTPDAGDPTYESVVRCDALTGACERIGPR